MLHFGDKQPAMNRTASRPGLACAALLLIAGHAAAEPLSEDAFLDATPVVLTATRLAQTAATTPAAVSVIDRQMIDASGADRIEQLFRLVPGFQVGYQNGHRAAVAYHLLEDQFSRRMQVLVDGRSVYTPAFGGVPWADLPLTLDDIERIEVVRGPNVAAYGANAFLGTININTRHAALDRGTLLRATVGSDDLRDGVVRFGAGGERLDYRVTAAYHTDAGLTGRHDGQHTRSASARADYRAGPGDSLSFQFGYSTGEREEDTDFDGDAAAVYPPHSADMRSHYQQVVWLHAPQPDQELRVQFHHDVHRLRDSLISDPLSLAPDLRIPIDYSIDAERFDFELQQILNPGPSVRAAWGTGVRLDQVRSRHWFDRPDTLENWQYRLFGNLEWQPTPHLVGNLGAMLEETDLSDSGLSPRLGVNYTPVPGHTARLVLARAERFPFLLEQRARQRFQLVGPWYEQQLYSLGDLRPEVIEAVELGYRYAPRPKRLTLDVKLYHERIEHLIGYTSRRYEDIPLDPGFDIATKEDQDGHYAELKLMGNYDRARITGVELDMDYRPRAGSRVWLAYAYTDIDATHFTNQVEFRGSAPYHQLSVLLMQALTPRTSASAGFQYLSDIQAWETKLSRGDQQRLTLRLAHHRRLGDTRIELAAVAHRIGGDARGLKLANRWDDRAYLTMRLEL